MFPLVEGKLYALDFLNSFWLVKFVGIVFLEMTECRFSRCYHFVINYKFDIANSACNAVIVIIMPVLSSECCIRLFYLLMLVVILVTQFLSCVWLLSHRWITNTGYVFMKFKYTSYHSVYFTLGDCRMMA